MLEETVITCVLCDGKERERERDTLTLIRCTCSFSELVDVSKRIMIYDYEPLKSIDNSSLINPEWNQISNEA